MDTSEAPPGACLGCAHDVQWHHDRRGCEYNGAGPNRCPCVLTAAEVCTAREEATLRRHADTVGGHLKAELLTELDRQITDYEAKALPAVAARIRENADGIAGCASDKRSAVLLVALLIENAASA